MKSNLIQAWRKLFYSLERLERRLHILLCGCDWVGREGGRAGGKRKGFNPMDMNCSWHGKKITIRFSSSGKLS